MRSPLLKRMLDLAGATVGLALTALGIAFIIRLTMDLPIFRQQRSGLHGKPFTIYKFRTMTDARDD